MSQANRCSIVAFTALGAVSGAVSGCDVHVPLAADNGPTPPGGSGSSGTGSGSGSAMGSGSGSAMGFGQIRELASGLDNPARVVLDNEFVYWVNIGTSQPGSVMRVAKSGGEPQLLATQPNFPVSLVVDDEAVYWTVNGGLYAGAGAVMRVAKTGGEPVALATGLNWPNELEQDDDYVYWRDEFVGVERVAKQGGPRSLLVPGATLAGGLAVDQDRVYFEDFDAGWILSMAKTGGPVTQIAAVPRIEIPFFAVDGQFVYWHIGGIGPVMQVATIGGTPSVLFPSDDELRYFVVTPDALYITEMGEPPEIMPPGPRSVDRITRTGNGNTPVTPPAAGNWGVAVDAENVYWTNLSTGTLSAIAR